MDDTERLKALDRRLTAIHGDLQDQILELRAELRKLQLMVYVSLLASLFAFFLVSGYWVAGAIFTALFTAYAIFTWALRKTERASHGAP